MIDLFLIINSESLQSFVLDFHEGNADQNVFHSVWEENITKMCYKYSLLKKKQKDGLSYKSKLQRKS